MTEHQTTTDVNGRQFNTTKLPNRQTLWDGALKDPQFAPLLACIHQKKTDRRVTLGERVKDLYNAVSKNIHKPGDDDEILILKSYLFDYESNLAVCLCQHYKVLFRVVEAFVAEDPDSLQDEVD